VTYKVIVPHPLYSPDLASCDFALFPKLKMKLKDGFLKWCLTSNGDCKWYLTVVRNMTSTVLLKHGKDYEITVYVCREIILKEIGAKIE
jgi:hypothetical protein